MRKLTLLGELRKLLEQLSGHDFTDTPEESSFLELGFDSLFLTQVALEASKTFGTKLKLRDFLEEHPSLGEMAAHLDAVLPAGSHEPPASATNAPQPAAAVAASASAAPAAPPPAAPTPISVPGIAGVKDGMGRLIGPAPSNSALVELVRQQIAIMSTQIELLASAGQNVVAAPQTEAPRTQIGGTSPGPAASATPDQGVARSPAGPAPTAAPTTADPGATATRRHGPQLVIDRARGDDLSSSQQKMLDSLIERYCARTANSKAFAQRNRPVVADPRVPAGFKARLKELVYPIVVERSEGCRLWDLDGNEYIDLLNGYGSNFFGFGAPFVKEAIRQQMDQGMEIGPQTPLVEEVSNLFRRFVPADRVAFCNTGSEAVLATIRVARTATGRDRVVMFAGGYHGIFDEVIVRGTPRLTSLPAAPGVPRSAVENMTVLDWGSDSSLVWLREHAEELAAVLVEPVQSRAPEIQPKEFLKELRAITARTGTALVFDEVVTGFRVAPGGAQEYFGIQADIASYGKVVGGGISIGIVAGRREFMDALDGGFWQFGDDSIPEVGVTYFAGTFVRHPIAMAAARAVLRHLLEQGPGLQQRVNRFTDELAGRLNEYFERDGVPLEIRHFSSVMKIATTGTVPMAELLFLLLRERGIHTWDGRPNFLTAAHGEKELDTVIEAFKSSVAEMQQARFYPLPVRRIDANRPPASEARLGRDPSGQPAWFIPDRNRPGRYLKLETA
jgi:glutamate-1-semialdehyde aminotransferase/acyl carrier protein